MADKKPNISEEDLALFLKWKEQMTQVDATPKLKNRQGAVTREDLEERVPRRYFYDGKEYKDDIHATVNGYTFVIPRGVDVMIPKYVADMIDASEKQLIYANGIADKYEREFLAKAKEF